MRRVVHALRILHNNRLAVQEAMTLTCLERRRCAITAYQHKAKRSRRKRAKAASTKRSAKVISVQSEDQGHYDWDEISPAKRPDSESTSRIAKWMKNLFANLFK